MKVNLILSGIIFVIITVVTYFKNARALKPNEKKSKRKTKKKYEILEFKYLQIRYNLDETKMLNKRVILEIAILNALIISGTFVVIMMIPLNFIFQLLIGFVFLMGLIYSIYEIYGKILVKRGYTK